MFLQANARKIVVKVGTNTLADDNGALNLERIHSLAEQLSHFKAQDLEVLLVSSGAVGVGMGRLHLTRRPTDLADLQACAAVGQNHLMHAWQAGFSEFGIETAQVLLTREDVRSRNRHLAIRNTLANLMKRNVIPVLNENDTVSAAEIKFGDNDVLSAMTASLIKADLLVILSTAKGLIDMQGTGEIIQTISSITPEIRAMAGGSLNERSTGGMVTKLEAAEIATKSGCGVFIGDGLSNAILPNLLNGTAEGTFFIPHKIPLAAKKRWLAFFEKPQGSITIDDGACQALLGKGSSLLAKGITKAEGAFDLNAVVNIIQSDGKLVARGVCRFDSLTLSQIIGLDSSQIKQRYPKLSRFEIIHRDQLVLL